MNWDKLLCEDRERRSTTSDVPFRNSFDKDYERIISSSSVRRLQDKAQVYPLQENDFTRTRLTHSLEVSSIGRSLGKRVGYILKKNGKIDDCTIEKLSSLLAVAGLVHDLGNPPFGHYGEAVIKEWFNNNQKLFPNTDWFNDYLYFDGNAQTIRILTRLQFMQDRYGMNFSYGTLATLLKYPWDSSSHYAKLKRKTGFFISEKELIEHIVSLTGMKINNYDIRKHPATYLLEAADDIAYLFADLEDTAKKKYLPWDTLKDDVVKTSDNINCFKMLREKLNEIAKNNEEKNIPFEERMYNEVMTLRVMCQGVCIEKVADEFVNNYDLIMNGNYNEALLDGKATKDLIIFIRKTCEEYAYKNSEVLTLELIGKSVLSSLLDKFINSVIDEKNYLNPYHEYGKLYKLISPNFEYIHHLNDKDKYIDNKKLDLHERVQLVIDYISCMTDSYALNLHKMLFGMILP